MKTDTMVRGMAIACLGSALLIGAATADTLETKTGVRLTGRYMGGTQTSVRFYIGGQVRTYSVGQLLTLTFTGNAGAAPKAAPAPVVTADPNQVVAPEPPAIVPVRTRLIVRLDQTLDSSQHGAGHMFTAALEADVVSGGKILAPKGSKVYGRLVHSRQGGNLAGRAELGVVLTDLTINNIPHSIETTGVQAISQGAGGSTVRNVAVGAGIGRLAKGTSKGAKRGAAAGLGASVLTTGSRVYIPAHTLLEFHLTRSLQYVP